MIYYTLWVTQGRIWFHVCYYSVLVSANMQCGSLDVEGLFPAVDKWVAARACRDMTFKSWVTPQGISNRALLIYLALTMTKEEIAEAKVQHLLPRRVSNKGRPPTILSVAVDEKPQDACSGYCHLDGPQPEGPGYPWWPGGRQGGHTIVLLQKGDGKANAHAPENCLARIHKGGNSIPGILKEVQEYLQAPSSNRNRRYHWWICHWS